jgi:hypothetical protein
MVKKGYKKTKNNKRRHSLKIINLEKNKSGGCGCGVKVGGNFKKYIDKLKTELAGGGYSFEVGDMIAGNPAIVSYNDCAPPTILNHKLHNTGCKSQCGRGLVGGKRKSKKSKKIRKNKQKSKKSHRKSYKKSLKHRGGRPASYPFDGEKGNFSGNMKDRTFGCKQPVWTPDCI